MTHMKYIPREETLSYKSAKQAFYGLGGFGHLDVPSGFPVDNQEIKWLAYENGASIDRMYETAGMRQLRKKLLANAKKKAKAVTKPNGMYVVDVDYVDWYLVDMSEDSEYRYVAIFNIGGSQLWDLIEVVARVERNDFTWEIEWETMTFLNSLRAGSEFVVEIEAKECYK